MSSDPPSPAKARAQEGAAPASSAHEPMPPAALAPHGHGHGMGTSVHEAQVRDSLSLLTVPASSSPSPVPPTPPPKDHPPVALPAPEHTEHEEPAAAPAPSTWISTTGMALSKLGLKAAPPAIADDPEEPVVIDISGPGGYTYSSEDEDEDENEHEHEHEEDPDATLHIDAHGHGHGHPHGERERHRDRDGEREEEEEEDMTPPRGSDVTDMTDADITIVHPDSGRRSSSDSPEHDSTLYGSGSGSRSRSGTGTGTGAGAGETEHPLRLALHPPSPPPWDKDADGARRGDLESGRQVLDDDGDGDGDDDGDLGLGPGSGNGDGRRRGGRNGRASPQRFVFAGSKAQRMHGFGSGSKPRSHSRPLIPHSAYYFGPPPADSAYGTDPCGQIGVHHPREVVRVERDYTGGELPQFTPTYPLELEGRITPTQFLETINAINEVLLSAHSLSHAFVDNALAFFSLQLSRAVKKTHYDKEMERLHTLIDELNVQIYNPMGLHIRWPRSVAFLFLEIEYY